ncbi:putative kinesin-like motor protein C20orf23 [Operophtera brumata]|uniref:Putative kinesin-like motor protein C20orf23 n=1 Tax=Operophtera brumata TaxID=104452 RepID=A0A0L7KQN5_OPEBR|nr:putative kinesin-like motor protein C20orf23 [Operophtera brumata]
MIYILFADLRRVAVSDVESLLTLVCEGTRRRRTAATRRNSTSSRSHALLDIVLPQGTLHLADLAGRFVPYRDSALTWLLKDCFTGGASTFIIATVSPSITCYSESASTLRWAERARQLPTPKLPSCGVNVTSKAALQAQLYQLIAELSRNFIQYTPETGKISYDDHHWELHINYNKLGVESPEVKIGSIMNKLLPKPDANSESTASSVASGSSDVLNTMDKNKKIVEEINKEVNKLFIPALERTSSSSDLKVVAPLRHKRRQYRSQEILPLDEVITHRNNSIISLPSPSQVNGNEQSDKSKVAHVPILHDSQRAEIVASVTERLYSKLKKKEEAAVSKMESMVDRKIMEPLSELRICTNARQRLMELSQKAMRNKRRIGIPAYTQTRMSVVRVKDQGVDVQSDLESYIAKSQLSFTLYHDVGTETIPMTPRCKEIAVGSKYGTLNLSDNSTITENKKLVYKNSYMMTDVMEKCEQCTQTPIVPPPRRKKCALNLAKYITNDDGQSPVESISSVISINISSTYPVDSESQSSDDNAEPVRNNTPKKAISTPDLLSNHCDITNAVEKTESEIPNNDIRVAESAEQSEEFPESEDCTLPRVTIDPMVITNPGQIKNMILGRNANIYPYNIVLSPPKERDAKRIVTFHDADITQTIDMASQTDWGSNNENVLKENYGIINVDIAKKDNNAAMSESIVSDSTDSSKVDTDSFIWKQGITSSTAMGNLRKNYIPAYKNNARYKTTRARFYREFLGLDNDVRHDFSAGDGISNNYYNSSDNVSLNYENQHKYIFKRANRRTSPQYENIESNMLDSFNDLDVAINNYEGYLHDYKFHRNSVRNDIPARTPTEYLQHLVKLRREVVKAEGDSTE